MGVNSRIDVDMHAVRARAYMYLYTVAARLPAHVQLQLRMIIVYLIGRQALQRRTYGRCQFELRIMRLGTCIYIIDIMSHAYAMHDH